MSHWDYGNTWLRSQPTQVMLSVTLESLCYYFALVPLVPLDFPVSGDSLFLGQMENLENYCLVSNQKRNHVQK